MTTEKKEDICYSRLLPLEVPGAFMALVTLNRPESLNDLGWDMVIKLNGVLKEVSKDERVRVIAITGTGRAFSAGGNLEKYLALRQDDQAYRQFDKDVHETRKIMQSLSQPVIALVNGWCVAGGLEGILLNVDIAYMAESAKVGDGHVNYGQLGGLGSHSTLPRLIGRQRALELLFTGKFLTAQEALEVGLVNKVVPDDKLIDAALEFANIVAKKSPLGIALVKQIVYDGLYSMGLEEHILYETATSSPYLLTSFDAREGLDAFRDKREPRYQGR